MNRFFLGQIVIFSGLRSHLTHRYRYRLRRWLSVAIALGTAACSQQPVELLTPPSKTLANFAVNHIRKIDRAQLTNFQHKSIEIKDAVPAGSDFDRFRTELRQAIETHDMSVIEPLIPSYGIRIGVGMPFTLQELEIEDTNAVFWHTLEKALGAGCRSESKASRYKSVDAGTTVWVCPNIASEFYRQYPPSDSRDRLSYALAHVVVVGTDVALYAEPSTRSTVVALLNNEVVTYDYQTWNRFTDDEKVLYLDLLEGWTPVTLADGRSGFLPNRYAYRPLEARAVFGRVNHEWKILDMPRGD